MRMMSQQWSQTRWNPHGRIKLGNWLEFPNKRWLLDVNGSTEKENQSWQIDSNDILPPIIKYVYLYISNMINYSNVQFGVGLTRCEQNFVYED